MSLSGECFKGPNRQKKVKMDSFEVVRILRKDGKTYTYQARGESTKCQSVVTRFVSRTFALDWERSTGKRCKLWVTDPKKAQHRKEVAERRKARKQRQREKQKRKEKREKARLNKNK